MGDIIDDQICYAIINNIPKFYHSCDLRNFFSHFVETSGFSCFHFRHRPEVQRPSIGCQIDPESNKKSISGVSLCCVIKVFENRVEEFISTFNKKHWIDRDGHTKMTRCFIKKIAIRDDDENIAGTDSEIDNSILKKSDLNTMIELLPPPLMPYGNVGTPTKYFLDQIKACRLPSSIISKLKLEFPHTRAKRIYSSVDYNYENNYNMRRIRKTFPKHPELVRTFKGDVISEKYPCSETRRNEEESKPSDEEEEESEEEEWDRHETLHNDVTSQERIKERLFEEKIELKWEKGGSGLVFYTDAQYWDEKEGDFDAKTADDWDIDMTPYYEPGSGDKDSRDYLKMRLENRLRQGIYCETTDSKDFAGFEKHTTGFGRRLLESQGWRQGQGVGKTITGISEPIMELGQHPRDKKGFGYRGEKIVRQIGCERYRKRKRNINRFEEDDSFIRISTVYDNPIETDPPEPLLRSDFLTKMKFRKTFLKQSETEEKYD